jgi:heme-degrading monooxygenase HmoA
MAKSYRPLPGEVGGGKGKRATRPRVAVPRRFANETAMPSTRTGQIAVIFTALRTTADDEGYSRAAQEMDALAASQPGYAGMVSARGDDRLGVTVSYWTDEASAKAWRDHPDHAAIRDLGRSRWYEWYELEVATVTRAYDWTRSG